jgi:hypothetical protein
MTASANGLQIGPIRHGSDRFAAVRSQAAMSQMGRYLQFVQIRSSHRRGVEVWDRRQRLRFAAQLTFEHASDESPNDRMIAVRVSSRFDCDRQQPLNSRHQKRNPQSTAAPPVLGPYIRPFQSTRFVSTQRVNRSNLHQVPCSD